MEKGASQGNSSDRNGRKRKSKGRMSYLKRFRGRGGGGGAAPEGKVDEFGQKYGDYVPAYGSKPSWRKPGGGRRREYLKPGMIGFLCTTNFKENECVREAYNLLNEYSEDANEEKTNDGETQKVKSDESEPAPGSDNSVGTVQGASGSNPPAEDQPSEEALNSEDDDIEAALANELKNLKSEKTVRKFERVDTGVTNVVFISTTVPNPDQLAYKIFDDVTTKKQTKSRFLLRLLPIELTCYTSINDEFKSKVTQVIEKHMKTGYLSFKIVANSRLNGKARKEDYVKTVADLVSQVNPLSFVDLSNAQFTIVVEILKTIVCLGIVKDFGKFKKYNLLEAGSDKPPAAPAQTSSKANKVEETEGIPDSQTESTEPVEDENQTVVEPTEVPTGSS